MDRYSTPRLDLAKYRGTDRNQVRDLASSRIFGTYDFTAQIEDGDLKSIVLLFVFYHARRRLRGWGDVRKCSLLLIDDGKGLSKGFFLAFQLLAGCGKLGFFGSQYLAGFGKLSGQDLDSLLRGEGVIGRRSRCCCFFGA
jgi:hypothetical protein